MPKFLRLSFPKTLVLKDRFRKDYLGLRSKSSFQKASTWCVLRNLWINLYIEAFCTSHTCSELFASISLLLHTCGLYLHSFLFGDTSKALAVWSTDMVIQTKTQYTRFFPQLSSCCSEFKAFLLHTVEVRISSSHSTHISIAAKKKKIGTNNVDVPLIQFHFL